MKRDRSSLRKKAEKKNVRKNKLLGREEIMPISISVLLKELQEYWKVIHLSLQNLHKDNINCESIQKVFPNNPENFSILNFR